MNVTKSVTFSLFVVILGFGCNFALTQPAGSSPKQVVSPRALISQVEIAEYRHAIKTAPTHEAKMAIRDTTYAKLRQRAVERGMVMSEPQPWFGGLHWGEVVPQQTKQKLEPQIGVLEAKPVISKQVTPHPTTPVTGPTQMVKPATTLTHPVRPAALPHPGIPVALPHPMKPVFPLIH